MIVLPVDQARPDEALRGGREDQVVERLLQLEGPRLDVLVPVLPVVDGEPETIVLSGPREMEPADLRGQLGREGLLQSQRIEVRSLRECGELTDRAMLAQVVTDDSDH